MHQVKAWQRHPGKLATGSGTLLGFAYLSDIDTPGMAGLGI
jgi:hypothetical protein